MREHSGIMRAVPAGRESGKARTIENGEEGILLMRDRAMRTLLPGNEYIPDPAVVRGILLVHKPASVRFAAGAGGIVIDQDRTAGGWAEISCRLLSLRRFAAAHADELLSGISAEELLVQMVRGVLKRQMSEAARLRDDHQTEQQLWGGCREQTEQSLLRAGWMLEDFEMELTPAWKEVRYA